MRLQRNVLVFAMVALLVLPLSALAQATGAIEGRVTRENGTGIGGVTVTIDGLDEATLTDERGRYRISGVPAGSYDVVFTLGDNFATREAVEVVAGQVNEAGITVDWDVAYAETITVVSASRRQERIVEAPAAVTIVGEQQIEREAAHGQVPKLLEFTPGAEVTQSGLYDYNVNTRGFNSSLNRRVATLIDGRDPSVPFLGAQEWAAISFPMDDFAVVEMVRGPSAALYGANASSGVLNMITKRPRNSEGGLVRLTGGELSTFNADFRWAGELGAGWYAKVIGGLRDHDDWFQSRNESVEYPGLPMEAVPVTLESDEISFYGLRLDKYVSQQSFFTLEGGSASVEGPVFQTGIGRVQLVEVDRPWVRFNYYHPRWNFLGTYNKRDAPRQTALSSGNNLTLDTENIAFELQTNWDLGDAARVVAGASYSEDDIDSFDPSIGAQTLVFEPIEADF
ncbi:MAG: TonB-dependent receptor plug domain-containing protein, partial [Thermoanaerobaculia bacterium]|nr:TonB-dependent receptor plug domain-containing protein [Thermoanaerobaculia bacterium]